jgi:perosamine synthetase
MGELSKWGEVPMGCSKLSKRKQFIEDIQEECKMIPVSEPDISEKEIEYVDDAVRSGWVSSHGKYIDEFEDKFSEFIGTDYGLTVTNGTAAIHLAVSAIGIKEGDEVIVPDLTFISPVNAVLYNNARPVICDVEKDSWCIDTSKIEELITEHTKAIIAVHLYGNSSNMDELLKIKKKYNLYLIEDTAESLGTEYKNRKLGSFGDIGCFSFYGNKTMTTGEGGFCTTDNKELYERMLLLRDHGMTSKKRYWHEFIGYNYRMTNMQAALGMAQLERLNYFIKRKREIADEYNKLLNGYVTTHPAGKDYNSTYWLYSILMEDEKQRDGLMEYLYKNGIDTRRFFYPVHAMPPYSKFGNGNYPVSVKLAETGINLPSSVRLTNEEIKYISGKIYDFLSREYN